jgi:hypothetical protein
MGETNFNKRQCMRALRKIGFYESTKRGSLHEKWFPPQDIADKLQPQQAHFIMIPRHNELRIQREILKELEAMGGKELVEKFKKHL